MEANEILREHIFKIIKNQIKNNDPPETMATYKRLISLGYDGFTGKQYLAQCLAVEIYHSMKFKIPFNKERYIRHLKALPQEPFDDQE